MLFSARRAVLAIAAVLVLANVASAKEAAAAATPTPTAGPAALEKLDTAIEKTRIGIDKASNLVGTE